MSVEIWSALRNEVEDVKDALCGASRCVQCHVGVRVQSYAADWKQARKEQWSEKQQGWGAAHRGDDSITRPPTTCGRTQCCLSGALTDRAAALR